MLPASLFSPPLVYALSCPTVKNTELKCIWKVLEGKKRSNMSQVSGCSPNLAWRCGVASWFSLSLSLFITSLFAPHTHTHTQTLFPVMQAECGYVKQRADTDLLFSLNVVEPELLPVAWVISVGPSTCTSSRPRNVNVEPGMLHLCTIRDYPRAGPVKLIVMFGHRHDPTQGRKRSGEKGREAWRERERERERFRVLFVCVCVCVLCACACVYVG